MIVRKIFMWILRKSICTRFVFTACELLHKIQTLKTSCTEASVIWMDLFLAPTTCQRVFVVMLQMRSVSLLCRVLNAYFKKKKRKIYFSAIIRYYILSWNLSTLVEKYSSNIAIASSFQISECDENNDSHPHSLGGG